MADAHSTESNYLTATRGLKSWLFTLDHKRIGIMYLIAILSSFFLGGVFALLLRTELLTPGPTIMSADAYNKMFTLHGAVMIFLFIIPGIPATLGLELDVSALEGFFAARADGEITAALGAPNDVVPGTDEAVVLGALAGQLHADIGELLNEARLIANLNSPAIVTLDRLREIRRRLIDPGAR